MNLEEFFAREVHRVTFTCNHCRIYDEPRISHGPAWLLQLQANGRRHSQLQLLEEAGAVDFLPARPRLHRRRRLHPSSRQGAGKDSGGFQHRASLSGLKRSLTFDGNRADVEGVSAMVDSRCWLVCFLVAFAGCARREPVQEATGEKNVSPEVRTSVPLRVKPAPDRPPDWLFPKLRDGEVKSSHPFLEKPELNLPPLPSSGWRPGGWDGSQLDRRFDGWHFADLRKKVLPGLDWKLDLEIARAPQKNPFAKLHVPVSDINSVLDDIEREQQARKEQYLDFPLPTNASISF